MTRTFLAIAAALLAATTLTPAAEACISCEYVPEVVHSGTSKAYEGRSHAAKPYKKSRAYTAAEERRSRAAKKHIVKSEPVAKKVETATTAPITTPATNENSAIAAAASDKSAPVAKKVEAAATTPIKSQTQNENSTISTATLVKAEEAPIEEAKVDKNVGCKKFFPTVGMTLSVPCE
jgi:hypothetical protein